MGTDEQRKGNGWVMCVHRTKLMTSVQVQYNYCTCETGTVLTWFQTINGVSLSQSVISILAPREREPSSTFMECHARLHVQAYFE